MAPVILYDNPSRFGTGTTWSPNVWKTRLLLNYKGIDYETKWISGNIRKDIEALGIPPHKEGTQLAHHTIPAVAMPDGTCIMESENIARAIEKLYPTPSVHLDSPAFQTVKQGWGLATRALVPVLIPRMPVYTLNEETAEYHRAARKQTYGMPLEEYEAKFGGDPCWEASKEGLTVWADLLKQDQSGPYCLGQEVSYADMLIVGWLEWVRLLQGDCFQRVMDFDPVFPRLYKAFEPWLVRNDH